MTPQKGLQPPERGSAPVEDPAIVAAKEAEAAKAAWFAIPVSTVADEKTPKYKAAEKREKEADDAFSAAPVTAGPRPTPCRIVHRMPSPLTTKRHTTVGGLL